MKKIFVLWICAFVVFAVEGVAETEKKKEAGEGEKPDEEEIQVGEKSLLDFYNAGGMLMHPILACSMASIAVGAYCWVQMNQSKMHPRGMSEELLRLVQVRDVSQAYEVCQQRGGCLGEAFSSALLKVNFEREQSNRALMEQAAMDVLAEEEGRCMLWVNYLNVIATIAPMIGLLGTVTGMIQSFDALAAGKAEPQDLANGIGEAMLTTAGGLIVGIPAMFLYFFFRNRALQGLQHVQKSVVFLIDVLSGELQIGETK